MTARELRILRERYPTEGASESLCRDLGLHPWQVRSRAKQHGIKCTAKFMRALRRTQNYRLKGIT